MEQISIVQNYNFAVINGMLIDKRKKSLIRFPNGQAYVECRIPSEIEIIESFAFERSSVKKLYFPRSVSVIEPNAFSNCVALESIEVDAKNQTFSSIDGVLHSKKQNKLIRYPFGKKNSNYFIEDGTVEISDYAFSGSVYIESITFTSSIKIIGEKAFEYCSKLGSLMLPASVEIIGERAFQCCDSLKNVMLPRTIKEIGDFAFFNCGLISSLSIPQKVQRIGHAAFKDCSSLKKIIIQNEVLFLGDGAFDGCSPELEVCVKNNPYVENYCRLRGIKTSKI